MQINLMGNIVPNDAEIESNMQDHINSVWSPSQRERVIRTGVNKDLLDVFFSDMSVLKSQIVADRDLLSSTLQYEAATARLAQYQLSVGKPEETTDIQQTDEQGLPVVDADGNPVMVTEVIPAIPPITEFILDEEGNETPNPEWPRVAQDDAERAEAQAVVDAASQDVIDLAIRRKG